MTLYDHFMLANFLVLGRLKRFYFYMLYDYNNNCVREHGKKRPGFGAGMSLALELRR